VFRWALISNTTTAPLVQRLGREIKTSGVECEFFVSEHGDIGRQVFSPASELYTFKPDLIVVYLDLQQIKPMLELSVPFTTPEEREQLLSEGVEHTTSMLKALRSHSSAVLLVNSFPVIPRTVLGIGMDQIYRNLIRQINLNLCRAAKEIPQCYIFDCESLWTEAGFREYDRRFEMLAEFPFGMGMQKLLVNEWMRYFRALRGLTRKCIVVDLDNTLWGGILGEDGAEGIQMGDTPEGRPFRRFQQALKALNRRGVLLAINSKNNASDVKALFEQNSDLLLRESDFAAMQINWDDKATNLARISREMNIGLQHMVFLDDNPVERAWVRQRHPEVLVPEMPEDNTRYSDVLLQCELDALAVTDEDLKRAKMYWEERQRRTLQAEVPSFEEFLKNLSLEVEIEPLSGPLLDRAAQLCQRTNQFNLTTRRHNADEIARFAESPRSKVLLLKARDRFGEYGWSGLAIVQTEDNRASIESFLVSCRVLGKNAEYALFAAVVKWAIQQKCTDLQGLYIPTSKNPPCKDFLEQCGMKPITSNAAGAGVGYEANLTDLQTRRIDHIKVSISL
jgi:FkbH-like protein